MNTQNLLTVNPVPPSHNVQSQSKTERLLTPREVASWLGVSERWVRDHATRRMPNIAVVKLGPLLRFRRADIESLIVVQVSDTTTKPRWRR
jgi:predicted DNA-binding transcriptional regulator AlpA